MKKILYLLITSTVIFSTEPETSPLFTAVERHEHNTISQLLNDGAQVDRNAFFRAIQLGNTKTVRIFLEYGVNPNRIFSSKGEIPLICAITNQHPEIVKLFLESGADIKARNNYGQTPLIVACGAGRGNYEIVEDLIAHGADINAKDDHGNSPLAKAAKYNHYPVAVLLIENNAYVDSRDKNGLTPLMRAAYRGNTAITSLLIDNNAILNLTTTRTCTLATPPRYFFDLFPPTKQIPAGTTALGCARIFEVTGTEYLLVNAGAE